MSASWLTFALTWQPSSPYASQLLQLGGGVHWFCGGGDGAESGAAAPDRDHEATLKLVVACWQVFAYEYDEVAQQKAALTQALDQQLGRCEACVVQYYKIKRKWLEQLHL